MADIPASTWSETDADNNTAAPLGFPEGMAPSGINNGARAVMGAVKRWFNWTIPKTTAGTSTAYTLSYTVAPSALVDGMSHLVLFNAACGASPTLNVNSLGAKPIYYYTGAAWAQVTAAGTIPANMIARVSYNQSEGSYRITSASFSLGAALLSVANTLTATLTMSGAAINEAVRVDVASATTCDIGAAASNYVRITGTTTITGLGTIASGVRRKVVFAGALTLTHNATSLILPNNGQNITTAAGDCAEFQSEGSGNWRCTSYLLANGRALSYVPNRSYAEYTTHATLTANIPSDNTIPQVGEGTQILSAAITPTATTNRVRARIQVPLGLGSGGSADNACVALFRNGGANAIACTFLRLVDGSVPYPGILEFEDSPGSTSAQTYTVRVGANSASVTVNGVASGRLGGGVSRGTIILEEIVV